nr:429_t:CDS:2 [Entrophospora candida]
MDLTPKGSFIRTLPKDVYKEYLLSLEYLDNIIPNETHDFLVEFFEQDLTYRQWLNILDDLNIKSFDKITQMFTGFFSWTFQPTSKYTDFRAMSFK